MKNILNKNLSAVSGKKIDWKKIQNEMVVTFGNDIFESWLKKN
tara:strand:+ start:410 stop:538 length:129 start_codon:yes stop_codon:yes gene_type:complete